MKKRTLVVLGLVAAVGLAALLLLQIYKLELIHAIVVNAVAQKAPSDYPAESIHSDFEKALRKARREGRQEEFLRQLLTLSQRIEKVQRLSAQEVDSIRASLAGEQPSAPE